MQNKTFSVLFVDYFFGFSFSVMEKVLDNAGLMGCNRGYLRS